MDLQHRRVLMSHTKWGTTITTTTSAVEAQRDGNSLDSQSGECCRKEGWRGKRNQESHAKKKKYPEPCRLSPCSVL